VATSLVAGLVALGGCGGSATRATVTGASGSPAGTVSTSTCGTRPGVKATGTPIKLGAIVNNQPGIDFTDVPNMVAAYFACVNANGGVNGHPIDYQILTEQGNPAQIAAEAHELVADGALGIVGSMSLLECTVDYAYWQRLGYYQIDAGIAPECYSTPNSAALEMGARYDTDGAMQYVIAQGARKVVLDLGRASTTDYSAAGAIAEAEAAHVPVTFIADGVPVQDPDSIVVRDVDDAGPDGAVVISFDPPDDLSVLQAAQRLGLEDRVKLWACTSPCNTDYLAKALGPRWNHKLFVAADLLNPDTDTSPDMRLYKAVLRLYGSAVSGGVGAFSQYGFAIAEIAVHALESVRGPYTARSVNQALENVTDYDTGQLCRPWTYGDYPLHIPDNVGVTVTPDNGRMVVAQGCTPLPSVDPQIAAYRKLAG
jgi:branched-chain amino acid transport system substrate-binding protein